ncbi:MAG: protein-L-isoaspartate(D-aspartate) O-methyltransferase [Planctomycetota bacterium]|jgi:protein-L-isoaspartate(D-aspartate) O-methyltransferase
MVATDHESKRRTMVEEQLARRSIHSEAVLTAMRTVPRHLFVPAELRSQAYDDRALALGPGQTISQPYIVALMTQVANVIGKERVLEVGTGSGYQAAVLAELCGEVYTIERDQGLATGARKTFERLHYHNIHVRHGDGRLGWPEAAPFDAILVTAVTREVPNALEEQLREGGQLVIPMTKPFGNQMLRCMEKTAKGLTSKDILKVRFVPLVDDSIR